MTSLFLMKLPILVSPSIFDQIPELCRFLPIADIYLSFFNHLDVPQSLWNDLGPNEENLSYMFDEITPVKACGDVDYPNTKDGRFSTNFISQK